MKSARNGLLSSSEEIASELFAQYNMQGYVSLNQFPNQIAYKVYDTNHVMQKRHNDFDHVEFESLVNTAFSNLVKFMLGKTFRL